MLSHFLRLYTRAVFVCLLLRLPVTLFAQAAPVVTTHYQFTVAVEVSKRPAPPAWVLSHLSSERFATLPSPFLRELAGEALKSLRPEPIAVTPALGNTLMNFFSTYEQNPDQYPRIGFTFQNLTYTLDKGAARPAPPSAPNEPGRKGRLTIAFDLTRPRIGSLVIEIQSAQATQAEAPDDVRADTRALKDVRAEQKKPSMPLNSEEEAIAVTVRYTASDLKNADGLLRGSDETQSEAIVRKALYRVGWLAFTRARNAKLTPQTRLRANVALQMPAPFREQIEAANTEIEKAFLLPDLNTGGDAIVIDASIIDTTDPEAENAATTAHAWKIRVANVPLIGPLRLDVPPYDWEDAFRKTDPAGADRIKKQREADTKKIKTAAQAEQDSLSLELTPGEYGWRRLTDFNRGLRRQYHLDALRYDLVQTENGLKLQGSLFLPVVVQTLTASAGVAYNVEEHLAATGSVQGNNLLDRNETFGATARAGEHAQKVTLEASVPNETQHTSASLQINGLYLHDADQRFGNPEGTRIEDRESGADAAFSFRYDTLTTQERLAVAQSAASHFYTPRRHRRISALDIGLEYRDVDLTARNLAPVGSPTSQLAAIKLSLTQTLQHTPNLKRKFGLGYVEAGLSSAMQNGLRWLSGDYDYTRFDVTGQATFFFGSPARPRDLFLRWRQGFVSSTGGTPIFRQPRLGGSDTIRGIENGEFTQPNIAYRQIEIGLGILWIADRFRHRSPPATNGANSASPASPLDNAYLKFFYDSGQTSGSITPGNTLWPSSRFQGYGVSLELRELPVNDRKAALTLGYAFSPNSALHRSGTFFTGIALEF